MTRPSTAARSDGSERDGAGQSATSTSASSRAGLTGRPPTAGVASVRMHGLRHPAAASSPTDRPPATHRGDVHGAVARPAGTRPAAPASGIRASKRAPPSGRLAAAIRPPWRSTIQAAIARPRPVPPLGASSARQKRSKTCGRSSGRIPGPLSSTASTAASPSARTRTVTEPPAGVWATALSTRIVTSCRRRSGSPVHDGGQGVDDHGHAAIGGHRRQRARSLHRDVGEVHRHLLQLQRAGVGPGEQQEVVDERRQVGRLGVDVVEGRPDRGDRLAGLRRRSVTLARITVSGVRSSWLALAANSRWRRRAAVAPVDGGADRDERPPGVDPAGDDRQGQGGQAAEDEDREERREQALLGDPLADHLDDVLAVRRAARPDE